jgi:GxxExxY protein
MTKENQIARSILDSAFRIHKSLGPGLFESVCEKVLAYELEKHGHVVESQKPIPIEYDGQIFDEGFRADLMVDNSVIVELKSVEAVSPVHKKQLLTYLRLADKRLGLLINFGSALLKEGIFRVANGLKG